MYAAADGHCRLDNFHILHLPEHFFHKSACTRCPTAVFYQPYLPVTQTFDLEQVNEIVHRSEDVVVVGSGCQHDFRVSEGFRKHG